ncbi:putative coiled-coil domain-containing protein 144C [Ovis aries]|uniref:putative coiled-coil domain-containing protein 144C n=1 Tax=Ovis aries TaxID=9940 RepID=UPI0029526292|nr:putative coiled-coil domain-containing protein 144C [Ovis aries]
MRWLDGIMDLLDVSDTGRKAKDLLCKNHTLQDEIASLRLEIDAVKNQKQEKEKKYFEDTETLQKAMKLKEEILTEETMFQYTGQLNVLRAENAMLDSELENNKQSKQVPETEVESDRSRLAAATPDRGQGQTSQRPGTCLPESKRREVMLAGPNEVRCD